MNPTPLADVLKFAESIARQAGQVLRDGYGNVRHIHQKGAINLVTEFDRRSEEIILSAIEREFPGHAILAEESGRNAIVSEYRWVVDPLDGTTNFAHAMPFFAVTLALFQNDSPVAGVTYDPMRDEMFAAQVGCGATLNGRPIRVSRQASLERAVLSTGFAYDVHSNPENNFAQFVQFQRRSTAVRHFGAVALDCAWTAMGRLDGYWEFGVEAWDICAGVLLVREAGGRVTSTQGDENFSSMSSILAANGALYEQMARVLHEGDAAPLPHPPLKND